MHTIQQELDWEREMLERGIQRYRSIQQKAVDGDRASETSAGKRLLSSYIDQVSVHITNYLEGKTDTRRAPNAKVLLGMPADKIAFMGLKRMMLCVFTPDTLVAGVCSQIGKRIEDEYNFMRLEAEHKEYHDGVMRLLADKHTNNYEYMRKSILQSYRNKKGIEIDYWTQQQRISIGLIVLQLIRASTDLFRVEVAQRSKGGDRLGTKMLRPTEECLKWVTEHDDAMGLLFPDRMPMLIEPAPWVGPDDGGYFLPELRATTPLVISDKHNPKKRMAMYKKANMPKVMSAINWMQSTPWRVNTRVLNVMQEIWAKNLGTGMPPSQPFEFPPCPIARDVDPATLEGTPDGEAFDNWKEQTRYLHTKEAERIALCMMVSRNLRLAAEMDKQNEFYYVYRCDFRGRIYTATTGLSPQGPDQGKGLLQFATGERLGSRGLYWLKVHGANKWGEDKSTYDERVAWIDNRRDEWLAIAADPVAHRAIWADADKPYQFLAFCFEYAEALRVGEDFRSHLPIALDGSCNGLQHFSAMLRDKVGGSAVNLVPSARPSDIYQDVADVTTNKLMVLANTNDENNAGAKNWLKLMRKLNGGNNVRIPRKLPKTPVMTLPYGSTQRTCTQSIYNWYAEYGDEYFGKSMGFRHAVYLTPVLWSSIGEVVIAARAAMGWLQSAAGVIAKAGHPIHYTTPLGFPVHQRSVIKIERLVKTNIDGGLRIRVNEDTDRLDGRRMRQGSSPNFVHCMDATHLMMVVNRAAERGIKNFAMIHDDFGVHARFIDEFHTIIRDCFVELYTEHDVLKEFKEQHEAQHNIKLPNPPPMGELDIEDVRRAEFFFG